MHQPNGLSISIEHYHTHSGILQFAVNKCITNNRCACLGVALGHDSLFLVSKVNIDAHIQCITASSMQLQHL